MKFLQILLTLFLAFQSYPGLAQQQANHWYFSPGGYLNFNTSPPEQKINTFDGSTGQFMASIADSAGNLLFYTDGRKFFNSRHEVMINGKGEYNSHSRSTQTSFIIRKPGSRHLYYNFITELSSTTSEFSGNGFTIHYSLVDPTDDNGKGLVLFKKRVLNKGEDGDALTVFLAEDGSSFWMVTLNGNGNELSAYRVGKDSVSHTPVITTLPRAGGGGHFNLKASPDSKFLVFARQNTYDDHLEVYRFNKATGKFSPTFELPSPDNEESNQYPYSRKDYAYIYEFSPDSKNIFIIEDSVYATASTEQIYYSSLLKYDLTAPNNALFKASKVKVAEFPPDNFGNIGKMQLSPDGRILIGSSDNFLSAINQPNACSNPDFTYKAITFSEWPGNLPTFPPFFFSLSSSRPLADAQDIDPACPGSTVYLGALSANTAYTYEWTNTKTSEKLFGAKAALTVPENTLSKPDTTYYSLKVIDTQGCPAYDSVPLIILPSPVLPIRGSQSVCPGVQGVDYWLEGAKNSDVIHWSIEGGEIVAGQGTKKIRVNWGGPRPDASIKVSSTNSWGCQNRVPDFKVKIFKELDTEIPSGPQFLDCSSAYFYYSILPTNGSTYQWQILNGEILEGQGSASVKVSWNEESPQGFLWIEENVNTELEVCFGRSDTLTVINPRAYGNLNAQLQLVSGVLHTQKVVQLQYKIMNREFYSQAFLVMRKEAGDTQATWQEVGTISSAESEIILPEPLINEVVYEYKITGYNLCGAPVESGVHTNILLSGEVDAESQQIKLSWNPYLGWEGGVKTYELYRRLDAAEEFVFQGSIEGSTALTLDNLSDGFDHCFYVKAVSADDSPLNSFSNELCLFYDHPIFIPNVITPNGDGKNDALEIKKLELYPENDLHIYNRYGTLVYRKKQYTNDWDANGLPAGVYYYHFFTNKNQKRRNGWIQVIR